MEVNVFCLSPHSPFLLLKRSQESTLMERRVVVAYTCMLELPPVAGWGEEVTFSGLALS